MLDQVLSLSPFVRALSSLALSPLYGGPPFLQTQTAPQIAPMHQQRFGDGLAVWQHLWNLEKFASM